MNEKKPSTGKEQQGQEHPLNQYTTPPPKTGSGAGQQEESPYFKSAAPVLSLPKGGGALKGIDEKFTVNAVNGTAALQVPLPLTPGRGGFTPGLSLSYNSGSGNSEFGLGWGLSLPSIQRKTDKQLPRYNDAESDPKEHDVFLLAGAEDLVPMLDEHGDPVVNYSHDPYIITRYVPRIEGLFARIELITKTGSTQSWWRVTTKDNIQTFYGLTAGGRISDPADEARTFKWLPQLVFDHKGNVQEYLYKAEDLINVPQDPHERNRRNAPAFSNKYLKQVNYCNRNPQFINGGTDLGIFRPELDDPDFLMSLVLDYGEHSTGNPKPDDSGNWDCRLDAFSDFHAGFEIRTWRRCKRALMFHYFDELRGGDPCMVRSLELEYRYDGAPGYQEADYIITIKQAGWKIKDATHYYKQWLPATTLAYQEVVWDTSIHPVSTGDSANAPQGLTGPYQWIDLWGEGLPGILTEQAGGWFYKQNLGDAKFDPAMPVAPKPSFQGLGTTLQWADLNADGRRQVVVSDGVNPGYFELDDDQHWQPFRAFKEKVNVDLDSPYTKMLDLDGDGRPDLLLTEDLVWTWYANKGTEGYEQGGRSGVVYDEEKGPRLLLNDNIQSIFLADMNGDGMTDLVRIRNQEICYWPNKGYGRFGAKVTMTDSPRFDRPDAFNPQYLTLADISGTGAADIIYLGHNKCTAWLNLSGNAWSEAKEIAPLPSTEPYSKIGIMDFLGNGTGCIVWSSPLPRHARKPMQYIDLMGGKKPYLLKSYTNGMGTETTLEYKSSTFFYLADKVAARPWATRLPFPVHCVSRIETRDAVSETRYSQSYTYHHGYYDHEEREFRGFGRVETRDTESAATDDDPDHELDQAPVLTKSWYHTGAWMREGTLLDAFKEEYFLPNDWVDAPEHITLPAELNPQEQREAYRALKGLPLRQEVYADDDSDLAAVPYTASSFAYSLQLQQGLYRNRYAVFYSYQEQSVGWHCERNEADPRVSHELTLEVDVHGNVLEAARLCYPRPASSLGSLPAQVAAVQGNDQLEISYVKTKYTAEINDYDESAVDYRLGLPYEVCHFQLHGLTDTGALLTPATLKDSFSDPGTTMNDISDIPAPGQVRKRLLSASRVAFYDEDSFATTVVARPLGQAGRLAVEYQRYTLASTNTLNTAVYGSGVITSTILSTSGYQSDATIRTSGAANPIAVSGFMSLFPGGTPPTCYWLKGGYAEYTSAAVTEFYMPKTFTDPWIQHTSVTYDSYQLLPVSVTDALTSVTTVDSYDMAQLQPTQVTDMNGNISRMLYDSLGRPVALALAGKSTETLGDELTGLDEEDSADQTSQTAFWADPEANAADLLKGASWRCVYRMDETPVAVAMIAREQHNADAPVSPMQIRISYTDGFGRLAMHKAQAAPDTATPTTPRWVGSGRTVYNNKGNPVLQYEPYFSPTHEFDTALQASEEGVSPKLFYDPLSRVFRTEMPDGSYSKTGWTAWEQKAWDGNDTTGLDKDPVTGIYASLSPWYTARSGGALGAEAQDAAEKALMHADTPTEVFLDCQGRPFYTIQHNRNMDSSGVWNYEEYESYVVLDIEGNRLAVHDGRGLTPLQYRYNYFKAVIRQDSIDSGIRRMFPDSSGQPYSSWDADMLQMYFTYDELRRPTYRTVKDGAGTRVQERWVYGEGVASDQALNKRGRLHANYEGAGRILVSSYDFKGNVLSAVRRFITDPTAIAEWSTTIATALETKTYPTSYVLDALNRVVQETVPGNAKTNNTYEKGGHLYSVGVANVYGLTLGMIQSIEYDAKGRRSKVKYGNGMTTVTTTTYEYDPQTYRVIYIKTIRASDSKVLQGLQYWYDAVGNITMQRDNAQQVVFFDNTMTNPVNDYTYDAIYRLIKTKGREHWGTTGATTYNDANNRGLALPHPNTGGDLAMRNYTEYYRYDATGNMTRMRHFTSGGGGWTRYFTVDNDTNRLESSKVGTSGTPENYTYDMRGNMTGGMSHLLSMDYNDDNMLGQVVLTAALKAYYQYDTSGQRCRKAIVNTTTGTTDLRCYVGNYEIFQQITTSTGALIMRRETLHVNDDQGRLAMIDTKRHPTTNVVQEQLVRCQYSDHLNTATLELDETGAIISYEEYFPFGSTSYQAGRTTAEVSLKRYRYTGKERDEETGLYYHGARYYAPWLGRWCAVDPITSEVYNSTHGQPDRNLKRDFLELTASSYEYCYDNPVRFSDPTGEQPPPEVKNIPVPPELLKDLPKGGELPTPEVGKEILKKTAGAATEAEGSSGVAGFLGKAFGLILSFVLTPVETGRGDIIYYPGGGLVNPPSATKLEIQTIERPSSETKPKQELQPNPFQPKFEPEELQRDKLIYRSMKTDAGGSWIQSPLTGAPNASQLGARTPFSVDFSITRRQYDIDPFGPVATTGLVGPSYTNFSNATGLSASLIPFVRAKETLGIVRVGDLPKTLKAVQDSPGGHVSIMPREDMMFKDYQFLLNSIKWLKPQ